MSANMDGATQKLLARWRSLENGEGLRRASSMVRILWVVGLVFCVFVVFAIARNFHPAVIAIASVVLGWVLAETNALRTRISQWQIFKRYIDWKRVREDSTDAV